MKESILYKCYNARVIQIYYDTVIGHITDIEKKTESDTSCVVYYILICFKNNLTRVLR